ncbi:MAG: 2-oxoglutarate and iron-dependent oxygenase domain-containing protein [Luminiphilus sp.]|nr:2-oxoglutarate and iron-dependent oxygenase domain-containing protein [Luminiphilus sp.]
MNLTHLPLIDLQASDETVKPALESAFNKIGFALITGHGIAAQQISEMRELLKTYFNRPLTEKLHESITPENYRGYIPLGFFSANSNSTLTDHYEGYKLHYEVAAADPIIEQCDLYGPNRWPSEPAHFKDTLLSYWQACDRVSHRLLGLVAQIMGVDEHRFLSMFNSPLTNMTLLHYPSTPAKPPEEVGYGIHPHKDTDALTLLFPDPVGGLWLRPREQDNWLEVVAAEDTLIVNIGDLLELWSGGYFVSTPHKVVNQSGQERYSFPFFTVPRHDVSVAPLITPQAGFNREPVPVGSVSREVWRTNWPDTQPGDQNFDLGTLAD